MKIDIIGPEIEPRLEWRDLTVAFEAGHRMARAEIADTLLRRGGDALLSRAAWVDGMGLAVKSATVFPDNPARGKPTVNGAVCLFSDATGELEAMVDFGLVTKWKTAGDSLLAARRLARPDSGVILLVGAGAVARSMVDAYRSVFPGAQFVVWNRNVEKARALAGSVSGASHAHDLEGAVRKADIICTATMTTEPLIRGEWLSPGTHLDLIGAYTPQMREVDDRALQRARLFVDSRATTMEHIGELLLPLSRGAITPDHVIADFYDLDAGTFARRSASEITIAKNGGGAHLDLMTARYILGVWQRR